jgi:uncharacterized protein
MSYLHYERMIDRALLSVVRDSLLMIEKEGLKSDHHLYLSFLTHYPGVELPEATRSAYPEEITIVLQHEFWNLKVEPDHFTVEVVFDNGPTAIRVPFSAMVHMSDPSVNFELEFTPHIPSVSKVNFTSNDEGAPSLKNEKMGTVLSLDQFRKK